MRVGLQLPSSSFPGWPGTIAPTLTRVAESADDAGFSKNVRTIFNSDTDNTLGLGAGPDMTYVDTAEGKLVDAKGGKARYVRLYSRGNNANELNHYVEVEVFGRPAK